MKRTWVVYVGEGCGHEMHNQISEAQWFGPYTQAQAEALERKAACEDGHEECGIF